MNKWLSIMKLFWNCSLIGKYFSWWKKSIETCSFAFSCSQYIETYSGCVYVPENVDLNYRGENFIGKVDDVFGFSSSRIGRSEQVSHFLGLAI